MRFVPLTLLLLAAAFGQDPPGLAAVLPKLDPKASKDDRLAAIKWVRSNPAAKDAPEAIPALERLVRSDPEPQVRQTAIAALAQVARKHKRPCPLAIVKATRDKVDEVRWEAGVWAGIFREDFAPGCVDALLAAATDERAEVRSTSLSLLGQTKSKDPKVLAAIDKAKADPSFSVRHSAYTARYAITQDLPECLRYYLRLQEEPDELLKPVPADPDERKADQSMRNLIVLGGVMASIQWADERPDDLVKALLNLLDDKSPRLRQAAAHLIGAVAQAPPPGRGPYDILTGPGAGTQWFESLLPYIDPNGDSAKAPKADRPALPRPAKVSTRLRTAEALARLRRLAKDDPDALVRETAAKSLQRLADTPELLAVPPRVVR